MSILTITEAAANHLREKIAEDKSNPEAVLLSVTTQGCSGRSYNFEFLSKLSDAPQGAPQISEHGVTVVIDPKSETLMIGSTIDYKKGDQFSSGLVVDNPQVVGTCGCGKSFQMEAKPS